MTENKNDNNDNVKKNVVNLFCSITYSRINYLHELLVTKE